MMNDIRLAFVREKYRGDENTEEEAIGVRSTYCRFFMKNVDLTPLDTTDANRLKPTSAGNTC